MCVTWRVVAWECEDEGRVRTKRGYYDEERTYKHKERPCKDEERACGIENGACKDQCLRMKKRRVRVETE